MKTVLIFRGLPRGRRQRLIDEIKESYEPNDSIQIDTPAPVEKIAKDQLKELSTIAFNKFKEAIAAGKDLIIVNNTNVKRYHYYRYLDYAQSNNYVVGIVIVPWNDMSDRELNVDGLNSKSIGAFKKYRREFQWEI